MNTEHARKAFLRAVYNGDNCKAVVALKQGVDVNAADPVTGMTALHLAVGTDNLALTRILVEDWNAEFKPDDHGRWPTLVAAYAEVGEAMCDYIVEAEARAVYPDCAPV